MVLGQVVGMEAGPIGQLEHAQALFIRFAHIATGLVQPIENRKEYALTADHGLHKAGSVAGCRRGNLTSTWSSTPTGATPRTRWV